VVALPYLQPLQALQRAELEQLMEQRLQVRQVQLHRQEMVGFPAQIQQVHYRELEGSKYAWLIQCRRLIRLRLRLDQLNRPPHR